MWPLTALKFWLPTLLLIGWKRSPGQNYHGKWSQNRTSCKYVHIFMVCDGVYTRRYFCASNSIICQWAYNAWQRFTIHDHEFIMELSQNLHHVEWALSYQHIMKMYTFPFIMMVNFLISDIPVRSYVHLKFPL